jgi:hypothetical protein
MDRNTCIFADIFVMSGLIGILEAAPATHVIHENCTERCVATHDVLQERAKPVAVSKHNATPCGVFVTPYDC